MTGRALVLEGEGKPALAAVRSLGRAGYAVDVVASGRWAKALTSRYCHQSFIEPTIRDGEAWCGFLVERLRTGRYDVLLLMGQSSAERVSDYRDRILPHVRLALPDAEAFGIARNKSRTMRLAQELGIPIPATSFPRDEAELRALSATLQFPVVVKAPSGTGGARVRYASTPDELVARFNELAQMGAADELPPIVQERLRGIGLGYGALHRDGQPLAECVWQRQLQYPASGGPAALVETIQDDRVRDMGRKLCAALRWTGPVMIEFKRDQRDGTPRLLEINPRFWGTMELTVRSGVDFPKLYADLCMGRAVAPVLTWDVGRRLSFLGDRILLAHSTRSGRLALLGELLRPDRFDVDWGDLRPMMRDLRATWWDLRKLEHASVGPG